MRAALEPPVEWLRHGCLCIKVAVGLVLAVVASAAGFDAVSTRTNRRDLGTTLSERDLLIESRNPPPIGSLAAFPDEILNLPIHSVSEAIALREAGTLDGRAVAVAGYWAEPVTPPECPAPSIDSPLTEPCATGFAALMEQPEHIATYVPSPDGWAGVDLCSPVRTVPVSLREDACRGGGPLGRRVVGRTSHPSARGRHRSCRRPTRVALSIQLARDLREHVRGGQDGVGGRRDGRAQTAGVRRSDHLTVPSASRGDGVPSARERHRRVERARSGRVRVGGRDRSVERGSTPAIVRRTVGRSCAHGASRCRRDPCP